jgi:transcription termination factor NusB
MDFIDRAIFLLGYIEYKELGVDKPLVLNEMVELAKRYGDEGSYRLIN